MNAQDIRNLSEAYLQVYSSTEEIDEATAAAKRGIPEPHRRQSYLDSERENSARLLQSRAGRKFLKRNAEHRRQKPKPIAMSGTKSPEVAKKEHGDRVAAHIRRGVTKKQAALSTAINKFELGEDVDLYDIILSYLLDEGYAETPEAAEVIMVNMSEDWRENIIEAYDEDVIGRSQISRSGAGGRIGPERKKSPAEVRRMKAVGGGKFEPVKYKERSDIGSQRKRSEREQQPTQERGSADVRARAAAAAKEERRKAALARIAAKKGDAAPSQEKPKPKAKEVAKTASELLRTKKTPKAAHPDYKPHKASGYSEAERKSIEHQGKKVLKKIMTQQETERYKKETGQEPKGKAKTMVLGRVHKRMTS